MDIDEVEGGQLWQMRVFEDDVIDDEIEDAIVVFDIMPLIADDEVDEDVGDEIELDELLLYAIKQTEVVE